MESSTCEFVGKKILCYCTLTIRLRFILQRIPPFTSVPKILRLMVILLERSMKIRMENPYLCPINQLVDSMTKHLEKFKIQFI